uniref:Uncharacterized protein n=1 Tax=Octopus bimaculoides TaxID=37653 RepID=A0A0L8GER7_OCTBM
MPVLLYKHTHIALPSFTDFCYCTAVVCQGYHFECFNLISILPLILESLFVEQSN